MEFVFLLIFLPVTHSAKHSLTYFLTASSGLQTFPEFIAVSKVDGVNVGYCDSKTKAAEFRPVWVTKLNQENPQHVEWHLQTCIGAHQVLTALTESLKQHFNQTGGIHVFQEMSTCEWDDQSGKLNHSQHFGYDGEDFISLDPQTQTWVYTNKAATFKNKWDPDGARIDYSTNVLTNFCLEWLKKYLEYGRSSLLRTVLPSVSLLQKTPSSPLSCHATGFYPDRAEMFWRKDGEELHEDVDQGEILPNHDGTFQMSVDLKLPSDEPEDWEKYECVFQLSGVKEDIVRKLDKPVIRTNAEKPTDMTTTIIIIVAVALLVLVIGAIGFFIYRNKMAKRPPSPVNSQDVMEQLNPEA